MHGAKWVRIQGALQHAVLIKFGSECSELAKARGYTLGLLWISLRPGDLSVMKLGKARWGRSLFGADETRGFMMITSCTIDRPMFCLDLSLRDYVCWI